MTTFYRWCIARWVIPVCLLVCYVSCSQSSGPAEDRGLVEASQMAERSYNHLIAGRYEDFLAGRAGADSLPHDYREQLLAAYMQFMAQQRAAHGDIQSVQVSNALRDSTLGGLIEVFLMLSYADGLQEEIVVPMVEHNGQWKMK